ncbi:MAG: hypothetical protein ACRC8F_05975 [Cetobacterium sp.]
MNRGLNFILSLIMAVTMFIPFKDYFIEYKSRIERISITLKQKKDMDFQFFYTQKSTEYFSGKGLINKKILVNPNGFEVIDIDLKGIGDIHSFRLDFGSYPEEFLIKEISLVMKKRRAIKLDEVLNYWMNHIESKEIINGDLKLISNKNDPHIVFAFEKIDGYREKGFVYTKSILMLLFLFILSNFLLNLFDKRGARD